MSVVMLDAMKKGSTISNSLGDVLRDNDKEFSHFKLIDMSILPCRSCGACGFKSPGKCVIEDDMHMIMEAIARCDILVMLTPIKFGGYSSVLKKAVDKFMGLCLPSYTVKYGHLLHPPRYGSKFLVGIGVCEGQSEEQKESFKKLVGSNALNLQYNYKAFTIETSDSIGKAEREIDCVLKEVLG